MKIKKQNITAFPHLCKGCGICLIKCPVGAIRWSDKQKNFLGTSAIEIDPQKCIGCGLCELFCPDCAILLVKKINNAE